VGDEVDIDEVALENEVEKERLEMAYNSEIRALVDGIEGNQR
jgi:hypothetical protein